jgi:hypothetical protein
LWEKGWGSCKLLSSETSTTHTLSPSLSQRSRDWWLLLEGVILPLVAPWSPTIPRSSSYFPAPSPAPFWGCLFAAGPMVDPVAWVTARPWHCQWLRTAALHGATMNSFCSKNNFVSQESVCADKAHRQSCTRSPARPCIPSECWHCAQSTVVWLSSQPSPCTWSWHISWDCGQLQRLALQ